MGGVSSRNAYRPFEVGTGFRIVPPETPTVDGRIDLVMSRGAFGSGEHETTMSCLEILERRPSTLQDATVLDVGSGTGILAIAALKLGAATALCIDIEAKAVENARENCALNDVQDKVEHIVGTMADCTDATFDCTLANIYGDILLDIAPALWHQTRRGGTILLSGILWELDYDVRSRFERLGGQVLEHRLMDEYATVLVGR